MDTSRSSMLTPQMLRAFVNTHQMEQIDEQTAIKLIQVTFFSEFYNYKQQRQS